MKLLISTILVLMLSSLAIAAPETRQLGPYTVSLNMNTNMNYQVMPQNPAVAPFGTIYPLIIRTDNNTFATISITKYNNLTDSTLAPNLQIAAFQMYQSGINVTTAMPQNIDGKNGFVVSGAPFPQISNAPVGMVFYRAQYWLDSQNCQCGPVTVGTTMADITSTYPQDVTQGLLSSIHVASGQTNTPTATPGTPSTQMPSQSMPPAY